MIYLNLIMTRGLKSLTYISSSSFFFSLFYKLLITIGLVNIFDQKKICGYILIDPLNSVNLILCYLLQCVITYGVI